MFIRADVMLSDDSMAWTKMIDTTNSTQNESQCSKDESAGFTRLMNNERSWLSDLGLVLYVVHFPNEIFILVF